MKTRSQSGILPFLHAAATVAVIINVLTNMTSISSVFFPKGGCCGSDQKTYVVGGWAWAWWLISDIQR